MMLERIDRKIILISLFTVIIILFIFIWIKNARDQNSNKEVLILSKESVSQFTPLNTTNKMPWEDKAPAKPLISIDRNNFTNKLPKSAKLYKGVDSKLTDDIVKKYNSIFELEIKQERIDPMLGRTIISTNKDETAAMLSYFGANYLQYDFYLPIEGNKKPIRNTLESYIEMIPTLMEKINLKETDYKPLNISYLEYRAGEPIRSSFQSNTTFLVEITFARYIDNYELLNKKNSLLANTIRVWIDADNVIRMFYYEPIGEFEEKDKFAEIELPSTIDIYNSVQNEEAQLINANNPQTEDIYKVIINEALLKYFINQDTTVPIIVLKAQLYNKDELPIGTGYLLLDAVK